MTSQTLIDVSKLKDFNVAKAIDFIGSFLMSGTSIKYSEAINTTNFTATAAQLTGASGLVVLNLTGTLGANANITTDTAVNILAALAQPVTVGQSYTLRIINNSSATFTWTLLAGTGVTITGTDTIAQNSWRDFQVVVLTKTTIQLVNIGTTISVTGATTGTGAIVLQNNPTIVNPIVTGSFTATGLVTNADLVNSSFTIAGHLISLGGTQTLAASDLTNGVTGTSSIVLANTPTLITPNIGAATGTSLSVSGQLTSTVATGTAPLVVSSTTRVANLNVATAGNADTVTTNANLTGPITSVGNATSIASQTGTGTKFVVDTSPTISGLILTGATTFPGSGTITSGGLLYLGNASALSVGGSSAQIFQIEGSSPGATIAGFSNTGATNPRLVFGSSKGTTSTAGALVANDVVANFIFAGDDGSTNGSISIQSAKLQVQVDGTVSTGIVPGRYMFFTMNAAGTLAERLRLGSDGSLLLGSTTNAGQGAFKATGAITAMSGTAIPAGGTAGSGLLVSSTTNFGVFFGSGAPTLSAGQGSLYLRSDGTTTNNRAYINTNGGTTWTALTTAA